MNQPARGVPPPGYAGPQYNAFAGKCDWWVKDQFCTDDGMGLIFDLWLCPLHLSMAREIARTVVAEREAHRQSKAR